MGVGTAGQRSSAVVWGFVAVFCLGVALVLWLARPVAADRAVFGGPASMGVVMVALVSSAAGAVGVLLSAFPDAWRWVVVLAAAVSWAGIAVLAGGNIFASDQPADFLIGLLLAGGAVGMGGLLVDLTRRGARTTTTT